MLCHGSILFREARSAGCHARKMVLVSGLTNARSTHQLSVSRRLALCQARNTAPPSREMRFVRTYVSDMESERMP